MEADELQESISQRAERILQAPYWLLACQGPQVQGELLLSSPPLRRMQHVAWLEMRVAAELRGQGIGGALLQQMQQWAQSQQKIQKVALSVYAGNTRAISLYRKAGFVEEGRRKGEYKTPNGLEDDWLMAWWP